MMGTGKMPALYTGEDIQQRASMVLTDVHYVIDAHFELTDKAAPSDNEGKFIDIARRRLTRGSAFIRPALVAGSFPLPSERGREDRTRHRRDP